MKKTRRMPYLSPVTTCVQVVCEGGFMSGSVMEHADSNVEIKGHEIGTDYDFEDKQNQSFEVSWE